MDNEIVKNNNDWTPLKNFEGLYEVNKIGNVRSLTKKQYNSLGVLKTYKGRILSTKSINSAGYVLYDLYKNKQSHKVFAHRAVAETFIPNPENKAHVNHINGIKTDNRVENLEWNTPKENTQHSLKTGLTIRKKGELSNVWKFSRETIRQIFILSNDKSIKKKYISEKYNVAISTIYDIKNRRIRSVDTNDL